MKEAIKRPNRIAYIINNPYSCHRQRIEIHSAYWEESERDAAYEALSDKDKRTYSTGMMIVSDSTLKEAESQIDGLDRLLLGISK